MTADFRASPALSLTMILFKTGLVLDINIPRLNANYSSTKKANTRSGRKDRSKTADSRLANHSLNLPQKVAE
jgi:hypothetical protein